MRSDFKHSDRVIRTMSSEDCHTEAASMDDDGSIDQNYGYEAQQGQPMNSMTVKTTTATCMQNTSYMQQAAASSLSQPRDRGSHVMPPGELGNPYSRPRPQCGPIGVNRPNNVSSCYGSQTNIEEASGQMARQEDQGEAFLNDQAAAETLVNLRSRSAVSWSHGDPNTWRGTSDARRQGYQNRESMAYNSQTESSTLTCGESSAMLQNVNPSQQAYHYSDVDIQNTISGLGNAIEGIQAQQVYMHSKQEIISNALQQVMTMLQQLNKEKQAPTQIYPSPHIQREGRQNNAVTHNDFQGAYQTVSSSESCGHDYETQDTVRCSGTASREVPSIYANGTQSSSYNPYSGQEETADPRSNCRSSEVNLRQSQGEPYHTYYHARAGNMSLDPGRSRSRTENEPTISKSVSWQNTGYGSVDNNQADATELMNYNLWTETEQNHSGRARQAPSRSYSPRRSGMGRSHGGRGQSTREPNDAKIPPFNSKEDWKVWVNRFEAVAERRQWDEETKLDHLLPKLQGKAGDFVYTQLPRRTLTSYNELIKELNSRFRVVETKKTYAARFSQRTQKPGETAEEFAAELKRLYAKAYEFRDEHTRQEDLVRRFLDGLRDSEARFEIEYNKEPDDIDEAVYHAVNFIQTRRRSSDDSYQDKKAKRYARRASCENDSPSEEIESEGEDEELHHINRVPATGEQKRKPRDNWPKKAVAEQPETQQSESLKVITAAKDMMQTFMDKMKEIAQPINGPPVRQQYGNPPGRRSITCYGCQQQGHIIRDCPNRASKTENQGGRGNNASLQQQQQDGPAPLPHLN